jgi:hypothetical protein
MTSSFCYPSSIQHYFYRIINTQHSSGYKMCHYICYTETFIVTTQHVVYIFNFFQYYGNMATIVVLVWNENIL